LDPSPVAGINANQTLMAVIAVVAGALLIIRHRFSPAPVPIETDSESETPAGEEESPTKE